MIKRLLILVIAVFSLSATGVARKIGGISMPETLRAGKDTLILNGAGVRTKFFMDIYVGGLFLKKKENNWSRIINADESMAVRLHIVSRMVTPKRMESNTREGFRKSTGGNTAPIRDQIDKFISIFKTGINKYDYYDITYITGKGTLVYKNGKLKARANGLNFKQALFGIWLGGDPVQSGLKKGMLGL